MKNKHLSLEERYTIKNMLDRSASFLRNAAFVLSVISTAPTTLKSSVLLFLIPLMSAMDVRKEIAALWKSTFTLRKLHSMKKAGLIALLFRWILWKDAKEEKYC